MPSRIVEKLKEKVDNVGLRTSFNLQTVEVSISLSERGSDESGSKVERIVVIELPPKDNPEPDPHDKGKKKKATRERINIKISDILDVKIKNFNEKLRRSFVLSITCPPIPPMEPDAQDGQLFLIFEDQEIRDVWSDGIRSLYSQSIWARKPLEQKSEERKLHLIKKIKMNLPRDGDLVRFAVDTTNERMEKGLELAIPMNKRSSDLCKEIVNDFVTQNDIVPAERASLYRYIRSVISRVLLEQETKKVIDEIDACRYPKVAEECKAPAEIRNVVGATEKNLHELQKTALERIGHHGPASEVIGMILRRNIQKTMAHNRMAFHTTFGDYDFDNSLEDEEAGFF